MSTTETFEIGGPSGSISGADAAPATGGAGLPILLVHGINMSRDVWTEVADILSATRRVISFDLRGHGKSAKQGPFTANDYADDALAVLDAHGVERAHIVGTSFGGSTAACLAVKAPERVATVASFGGALAVEGLDLDGAIAFMRQVGVHDFFAGFLPEASFAPGTDQALIDRALGVREQGARGADGHRRHHGSTQCRHHRNSQSGHSAGTRRHRRARHDLSGVRRSGGCRSAAHRAGRARRPRPRRVDGGTRNRR